MERIIIVKTGTDSLLNGDGLDQTLMNDLARQVAYLRFHRNIKTVIVSSGAIASGRALEPSLTGEVTKRQAAAMFGQPELMSAWGSAFRQHGIRAGEALLKDEDLVNFRRPLLEALKFGVVIVNGNDATYDPDTEEEIISKDNDSLARTVGQITGADTLIVLINTEGLLDKNRRVIGKIALPQDLNMIDFFEKSGNGTGGPRSKLDELRNFITGKDKESYLAGSRTPDVILRIVAGEEVGTKITLPLQGYLL